jgi:hypothetical protein
MSDNFLVFSLHPFQQIAVSNKFISFVSPMKNNNKIISNGLKWYETKQEPTAGIN